MAASNTSANSGEVDQLAQRTGKTKEDVSRILNEIETRRTQLPDADKSNLLMLSFGKDIPADALRTVWDDYKSGNIKFNVMFERMDKYGSYTPGEDGGTIRLNFELYSGMLKGGTSGQMAGALLQAGLWEEQGHAMDAMARSAAGIGGTSPNDEGAIFSILMTKQFIGSLPSDVFNFTFKNDLGDGNTLDIFTNTALLKGVAMKSISSGRILSENRDVATGTEYFGPEGHYLTTGMLTRGIADAMGKTPEEARLLAGRLALLGAGTRYG
jgi:hypothetical protein